METDVSKLPVIAMPVREKSFVALAKREDDMWSCDYADRLNRLADQECAIIINKNMSDEELAELDRLVLSRISPLVKNYRQIAGVIAFAGVAITIGASIATGDTSQIIAGLLVTVSLVVVLDMARDEPFYSTEARWFKARRKLQELKLQKLNGKKFLPYDAIRSVAKVKNNVS